MVIAGVVATPAGAGAVDRAACAAAYEDGQRARRAGRLRDARARFVECAQPACPDAARDDCARWLGEVEASLPTVILEARDAAGRETTPVRVLVDGAPLVDRLDGRSIPVDPGEHVFRFETPGARAVETHAVVREAERNRRIAVAFAAAGTAPAASAPPYPANASGAVGPAAVAPDRREPTRGAARPVPAAVWVLAGAGAVGIASFSYFGIDAVKRENELRATCKPACAESDIDAVRRRQVVADVSLGVGAAALGAAAWLYLARPASPGAPSAGVAAVRGGAVLSVGGRF